ncbi:SAM-dependent methyltransferase [Neobacillus piezotolerans]|uniref:SAM-dependent methyltransferase n=1 Tax=Neobacillus piezotolerans TaxID=2259171 RepID=A0A3D8GLD4_9BACI|nr:class I SAM-dependent methyltransferase [Neobacillus piezotolerans]RDU35280.1 SAM-dependent methyltransferase [Neobacillus piezotolerans]
MGKAICSVKDLLSMLDELLKEESTFSWDEFYSKRDRNVPFFRNFPDENLVGYFKKGLLTSGIALELGCGPGRNAFFLAQQGWKVDAVDASHEALEWGMERARNQKIDVNFIQSNIFELDVADGNYDLVYDSGCFHHIPPHRRMSYLELIDKALKPGGYFGLTCFVEGGELGGSSISDLEVYKLRTMQGGLGFTEEKLRHIFRDYEVIEIRRMRQATEDERVFGVNGLLIALFRKRNAAHPTI